MKSSLPSAGKHVTIEKKLYTYENKLHRVVDGKYGFIRICK